MQTVQVARYVHFRRQRYPDAWVTVQRREEARALIAGFGERNADDARDYLAGIQRTVRRRRDPDRQSCFAREVGRQVVDQLPRRRRFLEWKDETAQRECTWQGTQRDMEARRDGGIPGPHHARPRTGPGGCLR